MGLPSFISQEYFDELCLENYEVFDCDSVEEAVAETMTQLSGQNLAHISQTYPPSTEDGADENENAKARRIIREQIRAFQASIQTLESMLLLQSHTTDGSDSLHRQQAIELISARLQGDHGNLLFHHLFVVENGCTIFCKLRCSMASGQAKSADETSRSADDALVVSILSTLLEFATTKVAKTDTSTAVDYFTTTFQTAMPLAMPALLTMYDRALLLRCSEGGVQENGSNDDDDDDQLARLILSTISLSISRCEANKKLWMKCLTVDECKSFAGVLLQTLQLPQQSAAVRVCGILTALCTYDDFKAANEESNTAAAVASSSMPVVQSGHAHVQILADAGALTAVHELLLRMFQACSLDGTSGMDTDLAVVVSTLRALSIQDGVVKLLEKIGAIETTSRLLENALSRKTSTDNGLPLGEQSKQRGDDVVALSTALLGFFRNAAANDDVKVTICTGKHGMVMPNAIEAMQRYPGSTLLQEHGCGLIAAVALRKPTHAKLLVEQEALQAHVVIVAAMEQHAQSATLQRQAALALRNLVARTPELRPTILNGSSVEDALRTIAAKHFSCQDEVYAALRDLGLSVTSVHVHQSDDGKVTVQKGRQTFGERNPNFRPVYDE